MAKTKYQRGLCVFHGCKNIGTITPNGTQRFCQYHMDLFRQDNERHEKMMAEIHERAATIRRERRILFFAAMRRPEMRLLRMALWLMRDSGVDWREIQKAQVVRWGEWNDCWALLTDRWQVYTLLTNDPALTPYCFHLMCLSGECGTCEFCRDEQRSRKSEVSNG